jgi:hypothetical protein
LKQSEFRRVHVGPPGRPRRDGNNVEVAPVLERAVPCDDCRARRRHTTEEPGMTEDTAPSITGIHHFSVTVCDIEASVAWYERVFRAERVPMTFPHYEREDTG